MVPVYTGLYDISYDYDNERYYYEPNLALGQPTWINPNEAIVEINPSAKFNNKNSVTAWDVVNTYFSGFKGSEDFGSYRRIARVMNQSMDLFETIKPINNSHVLLSFENAGTFNMKALTVPVFDDTIISNHTEGEYIFESLNGTILQNGASGPYRSYNVNNVSEGSMSLLELFKVHDYWKGPANVSRLMFDFNPNAIEPTDGLLKGYTSLIAPTVKILHDSEGKPMSERLKEYKNSSNFHQVSTGITQTIWINMDHPLVGLGLDTPLAQYNEIYANWEPGKFLRNAISLLADRDEIVKNNYNINNKTIYYGVPAKTHWPSLINDKIGDLFLSFRTEYNPHWAAYNIRTAGFIPIQTNQINVVSDIDDTMVKFVLNNGEITSLLRV